MSDHAKDPVITRSATDALMRAMEKFSESEPVWAMVIFMNEDNQLYWMRSDTSTTMALGALEGIKAQITHDWLKDEGAE